MDTAKSGDLGGFVELVGDGTLGQGRPGAVEAPLMQLQDPAGNVTGGLAWWTGDQGVKAIVGLPQAELGTQELVMENAQAAGSNGIEAVSNGTTKPFLNADRMDKKLSAI